ncbi:RNA polymerase sigma-70 factor [Flavobacteriaceae bacterium F08102]|nr:RNA polymerase sigma-70 factor [Flavobacteriaceae bacterium F08102]
MAIKGVYQLPLKEFKDVFNKHYAALCLFANQYVGDMDIAKDVVQEVFVKVWEQKTPFHSTTSIKSFLYTAVKNKSLDFLRSKYYQVNTALSKFDMEELETEGYFLREVVLTEVKTILAQAIQTLPKRCREIMLLSLKEYSNQTIAEKLGISVKTVIAQKRIAHEKLRPLLHGYFSFIAYLFIK